MIIRRLYLKDFGCIVEQTFEFDAMRNVFMLHGKNGRGKSTILQALSLLLINDTKDTLKDLIRWGTAEFILEIDFEYDGHSYFESIKCDGSAERLLIVDNDSTNPFKNSDAIKALATILEPRMFKAAAFAMQNEIDIIKTTPAERREYLTRVYDLDFKRSVEVLEAAQKTIESEITSLKAEKVVLDNSTYDLLEIVRPLFGTAGLANRQTEAEDLQKFITLSESEIKSRELLSKNLQEQKTRKIQIETDLESANAAIKEQLSKAVESDKEQIKEISELELTLSNTLSDFIEQKESLILLTQTEPKFLDDSSIEEKLELIRDELSKLDSDISQAEKSLELHRQGKCPTCGNVFDGHDLTSLEEALRTLNSERVVKSTTLSKQKLLVLSYESQKREHEKSHDGWLGNKEKLGIVEIGVINHALTSIESVNKLKEAHVKSRIQIQSLTDVLRTNVNKLTNDLENIKIDINGKQLEFDAKPNIDELSIAVQRNRLEIVKLELTNYANVLTANLVSENVNKATLLRKTNDKVKSEALLVSIASEETRLAHHVSAIKIFKRDFPSFIITSLMEGLTDEMNNFLSSAYNKYHIDLEESKNGIRIVYGPKNADVSRASGYEQQAFSSAWRHAREQLTGFGIALLDEADSASDKENAELFYRTLLGTHLYDNGQLIIISHKDETRQLLEQEFEAGIFEIA